MSELQLTVERIINARADRLFDAWLDEKARSRFMLPMPGMPQPETEIDAREDGRFSMLMPVGEEKKFPIPALASGSTVPGSRYSAGSPRRPSTAAR